MMLLTVPSGRTSTSLAVKSVSTAVLAGKERDRNRTGHLERFDQRLARVAEDIESLLDDALILPSPPEREGMPAQGTAGRRHGIDGIVYVPVTRLLTGGRNGEQTAIAVARIGRSARVQVVVRVDGPRQGPFLSQRQMFSPMTKIWTGATRSCPLGTSRST